jgi:hypothetical protein
MAKKEPQPDKQPRFADIDRETRFYYSDTGELRAKAWIKNTDGSSEASDKPATDVYGAGDLSKIDSLMSTGHADAETELGYVEAP